MIRPTPELGSAQAQAIADTLDLRALPRAFCDNPYPVYDVLRRDTPLRQMPDGSWFLTYLVDNDELWAKVKAGEWKGFSVEGFFDMEQDDTMLIAEMREIINLLKNFA